MFPKNITSLSIDKKIPLYVFLELTRSCNLNCIHCYIVRKNKPELSTEKIKNILEQLKEVKSLIINFSGGEVFTRKDFFEIAEYAKKQKFAVKIFSNGTLINSDTAEKISRLSPLKVEVTIYSVNPKIHDSITRVNGSLKLSINALKELSKRKIPLRIKCPLMKQNVKDYPKVIKLAKDLGVKYQIDPTIFPKSNGSNSALRFRIDDKDLRGVLTDPLLKERATLYESKVIPCSAGHNSCAISCYGDVYPCIVIPISMGNLKERSFKDIWHNSKRMNDFRNIEWGDLKECSSCGLSLRCMRCPGLAYLEDKNIYGPSKRACNISVLKTTLS